MTECNCGGNHAEPADEEIVETEEVEIAAGLDEPVELGKEEALYKDMENTLAKLKEVLAYLEDAAGEEKAEEDEEEEEEEEAEEEEEEEEEKMMMDEKKPKKKSEGTIDELEKSLETLKKHGINVYTGKKATPAPAPKAEEVAEIDFLNVSKSFEEIDMEAKNKNIVGGF